MPVRRAAAVVAGDLRRLARPSGPAAGRQPLGEFLPTYTDPLRLATRFDQPLPTPTAHAAFAFATATDLQAVREFVTTHAVAAAADTGQLDRMLVAVGELTANTICHTDGGGVVHVWRDGDALVCQVEDSGHLADAMVGRIPQPRDQARGRGLLLANALCDLVRSYSHPGTTMVQIHVRLDRAPHRADDPLWPAGMAASPAADEPSALGSGAWRRDVTAGRRRAGSSQAELTTGSPDRDCR